MRAPGFFAFISSLILPTYLLLTARVSSRYTTRNRYRNRDRIVPRPPASLVCAHHCQVI